ncbi:hypothetical protein GCM10007079_03080 [Nocardiopsis terrae]|uniref:Uncharacterized protein n=1 Tax=Nocardiopsis terrae TaxID=372655 RepID=A0ABR9HMU7_9ACTN|nr:hypothetical protein [Nocardiopsis terrae]MBE1460359.1 hypothetical protein [Nocardiopsis terrae]GHC71033.1 hypothetical protein GCM10007079_03080 [Nocardiopsis terrae]
MKFEFTPEEEWDPLPEPDPAPESVSEARPPALRIAMASAWLHTRARFDSDRLHASLNRMLYTVEASRPQPGPSFADTGPELGVDVFRPEVFGGSRG